MRIINVVHVDFTYTTQYPYSCPYSFTTVLYWLQKEGSVKFFMHTNMFNISTYKHTKTVYKNYTILEFSYSKCYYSIKPTITIIAHIVFEVQNEYKCNGECHSILEYHSCMILQLAL